MYKSNNRPWCESAVLRIREIRETEFQAALYCMKPEVCIRIRRCCDNKTKSNNKQILFLAL